VSAPLAESNPPISSLGNSLLIRVNEGRTLRAFGHAIVVLLDGEHTGGKFTTFLNITPPGGEEWAKPEPDMKRITTIAENTDFTPCKVGLCSDELADTGLYSIQASENENRPKRQGGNAVQLEAV
jgi:hypothetical protein